MNCPQALALVDAYADGELDAAGMLEMEKHLRGCEACAAASRNALALKKAVKQDALFFQAPPAFRRRLEAELRSQAVAISWWDLRSWTSPARAAAGFSVAGLALILALAITRPGAEQRIEAEVVSSHVRSLMANHLLDVVSTDQHTVKPWFNGKLEFSPPVNNLAAQDFPLAGGRLDYVDGHSAAALVFQRHKHIINLFIWPDPKSKSAPSLLTAVQGYHVIHWSDAGMTFWAASDLNEKELMEFVQDYAAGSAGK